MFCDDDIIFEKNSFLEMNKCIVKSPNDIGFGFNLNENINENFMEKLKKSHFFTKLGIYHNSPGVVCDNGWHTKNINIKKNIKINWRVEFLRHQWLNLNVLIINTLEIWRKE